MTTRSRWVLGVLFGCSSAIGLGQMTGDLEGRVTGPGGSPVAGGSVESTGPSLPATRMARTDAEGLYRFPNMPPGEYRLRVTMAGLRTADATATVRLGATATVDFLLESAASEEVLVNGQAPAIDRISTTGGTNYTDEVMAHLPLQRNYADIVRANPGVSLDRGATAGRALPLTIYGATSAENQWIVDGVNTTNVNLGIQGKLLPTEFLQEVEVKTGGYSADYGRALGGVINVVTRSGGNTFHGDGFVYYDSAGTAADKTFEPGDSPIAEMRLADGHRVDYGFDLGGYFVKDRLWFFGAYDRASVGAHVSRMQASTYVSTNDLFPLDAADNFYSGKLTWNASTSTNVVGTVFGDNSTSSGVAGADPRLGISPGSVNPPVSLTPSTWYSSRAQGGTDGALRVTQLFGANALVAAQGSYHKERNSLDAPDGVRYTDYSCVGGTPDQPCNLPIEPTVAGGYGFVGAGPASSHNGSTRKQASVDATFYAGRHEIKAGGDYLDGLTSLSRFFTGQQQVLVFNESGRTYYEHDFFYSGTQYDFSVVQGFDTSARVLDYGAHVQDTWKAAPNLTVNLGLRWDGEETRNLLEQTVLRLNDEWQPRIGVVCDPWADGQTKVYAFAGRFAYMLPTSMATTYFGIRPGRAFTYNFDPVDVTPDPSAPQDSFFRKPIQIGDLVDEGARASSHDELTVGIERLVVPTLTLGLKGTYRSLTHVLEDRCGFSGDCVLINPGSDAKYASGDAPACTGFNAPGQCSSSGPPSPAARRYYRGVELLARESIGTQAWIQASYVYSSLRGNYDGGVNEVLWGQTTPSANIDFDYPALWHNASGTLSLDRTNQFRFDGYWVTPWRFTLGVQAFAGTGAPLNRLGYFAGAYGSSIYLDPRGSDGRLPTLWGTNLSLSYPIEVGPATVTLQAYLYNAFNKQIAIATDEVWSNQQQTGYPATAFDPAQAQTNSNYGKVAARQDPRFFRAAVKVAF